MRRLPDAIAVSVAVHAAVVAIVMHLDDKAPPERASTAPRVELVDVAPPPPALEPPPLEVAMLSPHELALLVEGARPQAPSSNIAVAPRRSTPEVGPATDTPAADTPATDTPATGTGRNPLFDMRRGRLSATDLGIGRPTDYRDALDHVTPPGTGAKPEVPATGKLQPDGGGTARHDEGVFHAKIAKDGGVTLRDGRNLRVDVPLARPRSFLRDIGRGIAAWYHDDNKPVGMLGRPKPGPAETRINLNEAVEGQSDLREAAGRGANTIDDGQAPIPIANGGFDITDALMRHRGMDPYAARKLAFLDSTRDERVAMGERYRAEQLAQASRIMKGNLDRLAAVHDPGARKRALFELWDDCLETGSEAEVAAGRAARALVIGYIRAHLPADSASAYTPEELAALNGRKSSMAVFSPYE